jgi:LPXTG-motif cell wall-anchored protein
MGVSVMKKLAALVSAATLSLSGVALASASAQAPDPYQAQLRTRTLVNLPVEVKPGTHVPTSVVVHPNGAVQSRAAGRAAGAQAKAGPGQPKGHIELTYRKIGGGIVGTMTKAYHGHVIRFPGPALPTKGRYTVHAQYVPGAASVYRGSADNDDSLVRVGSGPNHHNNPPPPPHGGPPPGGVLPDTGGPDMGWLLLGLGLVFSGGGLVVASRARRQNPYLV